jgi:hypothetical protein
MYIVLHTSSREIQMVNRLNLDRRTQVIAALVEGNSIR